jgi:alginate biosynthesis protein AlgX
LTYFVFLLMSVLATQQLSQVVLGNPSPLQEICSASSEAGRRPVWQGENGWLFEAPDLIPKAQIFDPINPYLKRLSTALKSRDILPVALVVPTRGSVAFKQLGEGPAFANYDPQEAASGYYSFLSRLEQTGFHVPDLLEVARRERASYFFMRDHHWRPEGARANAKKVAAFLEGQLANVPKSKFITRPLPKKAQIGTLQARAEARCPELELPPEEVAQFETFSETKEQGGDALFAEVTIPVVLAGTSNSQRERDKPEVNFAGFLRDALGVEVLNVSFPGGGVFDSFQAYLLSPEFKNVPPKVLIWETLYMSWHKRRGLINELRQLIPSVYGKCKTPLKMRKLNAVTKGQAVLLGGLTPLNLRGYRAYLQLTFADVALTTFEVELRYRGIHERLTISRTTRVPNNGIFYLELSSVMNAPLDAVVLHTSKPVVGGVEISVCQVGLR